MIIHKKMKNSALDTFSEASSLIETIPNRINHLEIVSSSSSSDEKRTVTSACLSIPTDQREKEDDYLKDLTIDRQISDEGYRSVRNEQQKRIHRDYSKSDQSLEKVGRWLTTTFSSSVPKTMKFFESTNFQVE